MAQYAPVLFGPIQFAHPSAMPRFLPSTASLGSALRKRANSVIGLIKFKSSSSSSKDVTIMPSLSRPTLVQSSHDLLTANPSRSHSVVNGAPSSEISELPPSYCRSWLSFSGDELFSSAASKDAQLPQKTDADDDILYITRVELSEQQIAERKIVELLEKDRMMD